MCGGEISRGGVGAVPFVAFGFGIRIIPLSLTKHANQSNHSDPNISFKNKNYSLLLKNNPLFFLFPFSEI